MAKHSTKLRAAAPATATQPEAKKPTTFLDLPAELRLQVYGYLLPTHDISRMRPGKPLRADGQTCSTAFMASCKQIYGETADILYGDGCEVQATISGWSNRDQTAHIQFLNQKVALDNLSAARASQILPRQVKALDIYITTGNSQGSVCDVQDMLFKFLKPLSGIPNHHLQAVKVHINVSTGRDDIYGILSSNAAERYARVDTMQEFRHIKPGDLSRAHLTAFLADPLRTLRGVQDGRKKGKFTLNFIGETGNPWREIPRTIRSMVQGEEPVPDFEAFSRYYEILRPVIELAEEIVPDAYGIKSYKGFTGRLAQARIRGDVKDFRTQHVSLTEPIESALRAVNTTKGAFAQRNELQVREVTYLLIELEKLLPPAGLDTSFFGCNESDGKLAEWQAGREERKQKKAEAKRKRDEEDGGVGGGKKRRRGGGGGRRMVF